jgi:hypothetical protein
MYIIKLSFLAFFREAKEEVIIKLIIKPIWIKTNMIIRFYKKYIVLLKFC